MALIMAQPSKHNSMQNMKYKTYNALALSTITLGSILYHISSAYLKFRLAFVFVFVIHMTLFAPTFFVCK